ncbi:zinc finger protein 665-like [Bradysia coprophila]|uniref:zinc finger protein 665-like n=1 Tax=Bradysia coprophila TaxID=38358 RepID=UPI00187DCBFA|nr:zinc finger protein 665-like [Bradysia coprophila]
MHEAKSKSTTIELLQCSLCSQTFKYPAALKKHSLTHVPKEHICRICNTAFDSESDVRTHKENVHTKLSCNSCPATFPMNEEEKLLAHMERMHNGKDRENAICADCGSQFKTQNQLKIHNMTKCGTVKQFQCDQCDSKFMTQNTLNAHKMIHLGEKKHLCNFCGKSFLSKGQLKVHERSHTLEKPFRCDVCDKAFSYRESLVTHSSLHTGIKPYLCEGCGSRFSCIGNLIKHRKSRPKTCGLPQFCKNTKIAPRASSKVPGSLTMKVSPKPPRQKKPRKSEMFPEEHETGHIKAESEVSTPSVIRKTKLEHMEIEIQSPATTADGQHFIIDDNITVESNIEIEFITSDDLLPGEMETDGIEYENSDKNYENNFGDELSSQQGENDDYDGRNETWENETYDKSCESDHQIIYVESELVEDKPVIKSLVVEEDNKNNITLIDDIQVGRYAEDLSHQSEIEVEHYNASDEGVQSNELDEPEEPEQFELYDVKYEDDEEAEEAEAQQTQEMNTTLYRCELCPKMYILQGAYKTHLKTEHGMLKVPKVEETITKKSKVAKPEVVCQYCHKKYTSSNLLEKHEKVHGENGTLIYKCSCCSMWFASTTECENHQNELHKDKLFCKPCNKMFKEPDNLVAHNRYSHSNVPHSPKKYTFVCPNCGRNFSSKVALSDHERSNCGNSPIYKCNVCHKSYHSAGSLKTHSTVHSGDLPHLCKYCGKAFRTQGQVKIHERKHNGIKPFKCEFCEKTFAYRESLLTHVSIHTGLKRFMCQACGSRFSCISNLQAHRKSHKTTCGMTPNVTKPVGPMGLETIFKISDVSDS